MVFFQYNCTSWKWSCDMETIAALKKIYEYLYLKDVLDFYELDNKLKAHKNAKQKGYIGVQLGSLTATLLISYMQLNALSLPGMPFRIQQLGTRSITFSY